MGMQRVTSSECLNGLHAGTIVHQTCLIGGGGLRRLGGVRLLGSLGHLAAVAEGIVRVFGFEGRLNIGVFVFNGKLDAVGGVWAKCGGGILARALIGWRVVGRVRIELVCGDGKTNLSSSSSSTTRLRFVPDPPLTLVGVLVGVFLGVVALPIFLGVDFGVDFSEAFLAALSPMVALALFLITQRCSEMARAVGRSK